MRKIILFIFLFLPGLINAQERLSRAYVGVALHDSEIGGSLVNSFGINQYLGVGVGVDFTSYASQLLVPLYADVRVKYPINNLSPFVFGQGGKPLYKKEDAITFTDMGAAAIQAKETGSVFFGGGAGISYKLSKVGVFLSYTYRSYKFSYDISGGNFPAGIEDSYTKGISVITAGLIF